MMKAISRTNEGENEPQVTKEDQRYINEFSRLHGKNKIHDIEIKKINEVLQSLDDCISAIEESFGATLKLNIGESFIAIDEDQAKEYVEKQQKKYQIAKDELIEKYENNKKRLDELKIILSSKFGKSIHLDED